MEGMRSKLQNQKAPQDLDSAKTNTERKQMIENNKKEGQKRDFFLKKLREDAKIAQDPRYSINPGRIFNRAGNAVKERYKLLKDLEKNDGKTLSEKVEALSKFNERLGIKVIDPQLELAEKLLSAELDWALEPTKTLKEKQATLMGFVATSFKVDFGASISEALMQESDIGLKAGSILLDADKNKDVPVDEKAIAQLAMKHQAEGQLKMAKLDKQVKEMEIEKAKAAEDNSKLFKLNEEMKKLNKIILGH